MGFAFAQLKEHSYDTGTVYYVDVVVMFRDIRVMFRVFGFRLILVLSSKETTLVVTSDQN